ADDEEKEETQTEMPAAKSNASSPTGPHIQSPATPPTDADAQPPTVVPLPPPESSWLGEELTPLTASSDPLGPSTVLENLADLSSDPLAAALSASDRIRPAAADILAHAAPATAKAGMSWTDRAQRLVAVEDADGISYSLWFLIAAGAFLGILVCLVAFSYFQSTKEADVPRNRATENGSTEVHGSRDH